jgi:serine/threonine protein kinase
MNGQSWVGKTIGGRYQIEDLLGQGGMSAVYRAYDPNLRRVVAIKLIHTHLATDPNFIGRFKEEAAAVARLRHSNIVQVHDFNIDDGTYYMVMEFLTGETLQARLRRLNKVNRLMSQSEAVEICTQICDAVGYAHNHELIHRDIKPANIMLDVNGRAILMDFGIVKIIGGDYHTATGATIGTAMYMSPEQIRSERIDDRSDIYSLGVTLYEMISGQPPYQADSAMSLMMMVINDPLPDLRKLRAGVPDQLLAVVNKALAKEPTDRFQSIAEMAARLQLAQEQLEKAAPVDTVLDEVEMAPELRSSMDVTVRDTASQTEEVEHIYPQVTTHHEVGIAESPTVQEAASEPEHAIPQSAEFTEKITSSLKSQRIIFAVIGILLILVLAIGGSLYSSARSSPELSLTPISRPAVPVNAQTAQYVVNLGSWEIGSFIEALQFSPDGDLLGTANNREEHRFSPYRFYSGLWRVETGSLQDYLLEHSQWVYDVGFSANGQLFASASDDAAVNLWQLNDGSMVRKMIAPFGSLSSLDFSPNNSLLAAGSWNGVVGVWDLTNGNLLRMLNENENSILDVAFSPDSQLLAAASEDHTILVWQVGDGNLVQILQGHQAPVRKVVFSPDGTLLASASEDRQVGLWQVSDGSLLRSLPGHSEPVLDVAFSADGSILVSGSGDGTLRLWQVSDGNLASMLAEDLESITSVAFSPGGSLLVSGTSNGLVQFWGISESLQIEMDPGAEQP